jgi:uncharacterized protein involved in outer membrane biogenesis
MRPDKKRIVAAVGIALVALVGLALALPFFIPLDEYLPRIEKEASARLGEPVSISKIRLSAFPVPHVVIDGIAVGKRNDGKGGGTADLQVGKVTLTPDLFSLLSDTKVLRTVEIETLVLTQKALDKLPLLAKQDPNRSAAVRVGAIRLDDALVKLDSGTIGPFDARVRLDAKGDPAEVSLVTRDGKLKALVTPEASGSTFAISASAKNWTAPLGPPLVFDQLEIKGVATLKDATFSQIDAKLYGGAANGSAAVAWQKGLQLKGKFDLTQLELKNVVPLVSPGTKLGGRLNAKPVFSASAPEAGQILNVLRLETPFDVQKGVLHGIDIQKAAMSFGKNGTGGETHFDRLSGHLVLDRRTYRFTQLNIASGALAADGSLGISPRKELSGRVNAKVNVVGTTAGVALNVSGTVQSPSLMPTAGTLAGAAIGTAVLPGIGTGVGAKAGQLIEGLFGQKPAKPAR